MLISIIISTKDKPWSVLSKTLDSIISSDFTDLEVILVDQNNNSNFKSEITAGGKYESIKYFHSSQKGLSRGRNLGITHSVGTWLLFFDDDAIMPEHTLHKVFNILTENMNNTVIFYGTVLSSDTNKPYLKKAVTMGRKINLINFDSVCSIALIFNKNIFDEIGCFDEELGAGCRFGGAEESDMIIRAVKNRYGIIFLEDFNVYHPSSDLTDWTKRESFGMGVGALYRKHIFSSFNFFFILAFRMFTEILIRAALVLKNLTHADLKKYHYYYVQGILKGFIQFKAYKHEAEKLC